MTGARVEFSVDAQADVARLALWVGLDSGEARAQAVIDRIDATLARLARRPRLGRIELSFKGEPRVFSVYPWKIVYEPLPETDGIYVLRILDSRQNLSALLGKKT
ncbi:type II toxin-antitoxin system RelE/ParE family toxin [Caulobacter sp.]|uniref:type II toxin-antitoxin system RelE/ParE family toxin n=1 Tax=Caulobacter sp. TaxID=78 RepID=UPI001AFD3CC9|nr:type II toxin-antitoxin system RelE/ParE family toxin [Caulobacter sp.]MBO9545674.1 type II toxin-antitoxin system RelE/ParE family toxin [Caulobacter sp.]